MNNLPISPKELDKQSPVKIDRWVVVGTEEWKRLDDNHDLSKKIIANGMLDPAYLFTDRMGRIFGRNQQGYFYPLHFEYGKELIGYRIAVRASN